MADVTSAGETWLVEDERDDRVRRDLAETDTRLAVALFSLAGLLFVVFSFHAFVVPQTPVRLARPSAGLIDDFAPWSWLQSALPSPSGQFAVATSLAVAILVAFALYGLGVYVTWTRPAGRRLFLLASGAGALFLVVAALALPNTNTDIYNYIVTGRVAAVHDENPYTVAPNRFPEDPLYRYAEPRYTQHPDVKLPAWMLLSIPLARIGGDDPVGNLFLYRAAFLAFGLANIALVAAIMQRLNPRYTLAAVVAWSWNPIVAVFSTSKVDTVMVFFLLLGILLLLAARARLGVVALALSPLVKLITLPFLAAYWLRELAHRHWRALAVATGLVGATVAALYLPFGASADLLLDHLGLLERRSGGGPPEEGGGRPGPARLLLAVGFGFLILWVGLTQGETLRRQLRGWALLGVYFALFLAPLGLSWYLMAPLAVACVALDWRLLLLTGLLSFSSFLVNTWDSMSTPEFPLPNVFAVSRAAVYLAPVVVGVLAVLALLARRGSPPARSA